MLVLHRIGRVDLAGDAMPYIKIAWMEIYKHARRIIARDTLEAEGHLHNSTDNLRIAAANPSFC